MEIPSRTEVDSIEPTEKQALAFSPRQPGADRMCPGHTPANGSAPGHACSGCHANGRATADGDTFTYGSGRDALVRRHPPGHVRASLGLG